MKALSSTFRPLLASWRYAAISTLVLLALLFAGYWPRYSRRVALEQEVNRAQLSLPQVKVVVATAQTGPRSLTLPGSLQAVRQALVFARATGYVRRWNVDIGDLNLMDRLGFPGMEPEGQFLPETYRFIAGTSDLEILRQAHAALERELNAAWAGREPGLPLQSSRELLIMASIVQKESGLPQEIGKIAGLYLHRLRLGMRLQADPTVIYGMGDSYGGDIRTVDLRTDGPFNTYTRAGLPPTPIALPGAAAIRATAHPEKTDAIYFVASPKDDGSHVFSATLDEHNAAVASYVTHQRRKAAGEPVR